MVQQLELAVEAVDVLRGAPLFSDLPEDAIEGLARIAKLCPARRGDLIVRPGEGCHAVYIVISGQMSLGWDTEDGQHVPLLEYGPGGICGPVLATPRLAAMSYLEVTSQTALLLRLPMAAVNRLKDDLQSFRQAYEELLLERLAESFDRITSLVTLTAEEYLARRLAARARGYGSRTVPDTQEELAAWLGVTRGRVATLIAIMLHDGLIEHPPAGRGILVPDPDLLDGQ